jgi:hypothetical protein
MHDWKEDSGRNKEGGDLALHLSRLDPEPDQTDQYDKFF